MALPTNDAVVATVLNVQGVWGTGIFKRSGANDRRWAVIQDTSANAIKTYYWNGSSWALQFTNTAPTGYSLPSTVRWSGTQSGDTVYLVGWCRHGANDRYELGAIILTLNDTGGTRSTTTAHMQGTQMLAFTRVGAYPPPLAVIGTNCNVFACLATGKVMGTDYFRVSRTTVNSSGVWGTVTTLSDSREGDASPVAVSETNLGTAELGVYYASFVVTTPRTFARKFNTMGSSWSGTEYELASDTDAVQRGSGLSSTTVASGVVTIPGGTLVSAAEAASWVFNWTSPPGALETQVWTGTAARWNESSDNSVVVATRQAGGYAYAIQNTHHTAAFDDIRVAHRAGTTGSWSDQTALYHEANRDHTTSAPITKGVLVQGGATKVAFLVYSGSNNLRWYETPLETTGATQALAGKANAASSARASTLDIRKDLAGTAGAASDASGSLDRQLSLSGQAATASGALAALSVGQQAYPAVDVSVSGWENEVGGTTNLYQSIDEDPFSDADYIRLSP